MMKFAFLMIFLISSLAFADTNEDLISWAQKGYEEDLAELLSQNPAGLKINYQDQDGNTALHHAVMKNNPRIIAVLKNAYPLGAQLNFNVKNVNGETPFYLAVRSCADCVLELLKSISKIDIEAGPITPLVGAIIDENDSLAARLIKLGANTKVYVSYSDGSQLPILYSMVVQNLIVSLKEFVKVNKELNLRFDYKQTALMLAVGNFELTRVLVENGASLNLRDEFGNTAVHYAAKAYRTYNELGATIDQSIYDYLVSKGARLDYLNNKNHTAEYIFQTAKSYFFYQDNFKSSLFEIMKQNSGDYDFKISPSNHLFSLSFDRDGSTTFLDMSQPFEYAYSMGQLTFKLLDSFTFKLNSSDELNSLKENVMTLQTVAEMYKKI